jgi:cyanophycinase
MKKIVLAWLLLWPVLGFGQGKLFIIGGGPRPASLIERLAQEAGLNEPTAYALVISFASAEPDSAGWYGRQQFLDLGFSNIVVLQVDTTSSLRPTLADSLLRANLIYLTGGDQNRLMRIARRTGADKLFSQAYRKGATVAGTSAGAAVMSHRMITGTELRYSDDYQSTFRSLQTNNLETEEGLGLLPERILIDQHFVQRSRYNRLLTAVLENPKLLGIGIDESTALLIRGNKAEVVGLAQVVIFRNLQQVVQEKEGLLGSENIRLSIYLPGNTVTLSSK